jgi:hypothetical protein
MRAFSRVYGVVAVLGLVSTSACLRKEATHTIYISPSGVTWSTIEKDVRSDDVEPDRRLFEEQDYILNARAGQHGVARALRLLGGTRVDTTILRRERPFTVLTDGQFGDPAQLAIALMRAVQVRGDATMERDGCERMFRAWMDVESSTSDGSNPVADLIAEASSYRLVLADGRFLRGEGFTIEDDGSVATPGAPSTLEDGTVRVSLTWREGWCAPLAR